MEEPKKATSAPLLAASFLIGKECLMLNDFYVNCRNEAVKAKTNISNCFHIGRQLEQCIDLTFDKIRTSCQKCFERYWRCLDLNNHNQIFCRDEEHTFDACLQEKLVPTLY